MVDVPLLIKLRLHVGIYKKKKTSEESPLGEHFKFRVFKCILNNK